MNKQTFTTVPMLLTLLLGCGSGSDNNTDPPVPEGATLISEQEYNELDAAGNLDPISPTRLPDQAATELQQDAEDDKVIQAYLDENPGIGQLLPAPPPADDPDITETGDGNYLLKVILRNGAEQHFVTYGQRWFRRTIANGLRTFKTRDNQLKIYRALYEGLPPAWKARVAHPPEYYDADPTKTGVEIHAGVASIMESAESLLAALKPSGLYPAPPGITQCENAIGYGNGSDLTDSKFDGSCNVDPFGIVVRHNWALKPFITCVKSQAGRGTCTGFANTSSIEMQVWKTHGLRVNLSEQAYYNRARLKWSPGDYGDGLMSEIGFKKMAQENFLLYFENQWNYNPSKSRLALKDKQKYLNSCLNYTDTCSDTTHQSKHVCSSSNINACAYTVPEKNPGHLGFRIGNSAEFWDPTDTLSSLVLTRIYLAMGYSVVLGMPVGATMKTVTKQSGVMPYVANDSFDGGHGMHAVGYINNVELTDINSLRADTGVAPIPDGVGGGYLIIKNSWGNCYGDGGFVYVPYQAVKDYAKDITVLFDVL